MLLARVGTVLSGRAVAPQDVQKDLCVVLPTEEDGTGRNCAGGNDRKDYIGTLHTR